MFAFSDDVSVPELALHMDVPAVTVRWHCRNPAGKLHGRARLISGRWIIPADVATEFARTYVPALSGRKRKESAVPSCPGALPANHPSQKG
jgi:hypothetical protein